MRILDPASATYLAARTGVASRHMVHVVARNRATGAQEALGLWQGDDHLTIAIGGVNRTYYGAGGLIGVEPIRAGIGLEVRMLQIALSPLTPEVAQLLRGHDARLAPAEVHRALLAGLGAFAEVWPGTWPAGRRTAGGAQTAGQGPRGA